MKILRSGISLLFPLLVGIALLLALTNLPSLVRFEHLAFLYPGRFHDDLILSERVDLNEFKITLIDFSENKDPPLNIGTYEIDQETTEIMGPTGSRPIEWAQFLNQTRLEDDRLTVITSSLSWNDAAELPLLALQEQISSTPNLVIGLRGELLNSEAPLVEYLRSSVIPADSFSSLDLPEIDHISFQPSVEAPLFGISDVRGLKIEKEGDFHEVPMLVRWGDQLLPTLPLACLLTTHGMKPSELKLAPTGHLRFGETGIILKLDSRGFTPLRSTEAPLQSASKLQVYPEQSETYKVIVLPDAPPAATRLTAQLQQALSQLPRPLKTYQRFHLTIEIAFLIVMALFLETRRVWISLPGFAALLGGSLMTGYWILLTPLVALILAQLVVRKLTPQPRASRKKKKKRA
ncbi:MAG: hypothetical protein ACJAVK_001748 [Akkermansiaceae bacterium]|jgi:hypothetical protein